MEVTDPRFVYPPKPMYIPPGSSVLKDLDNDERWVAEVKKNGWRCMVRVFDGKISLWTRHRTIITDPLPKLRLALYNLGLPNDTILDGELLEHRSTTKQTMMIWGIIRWQNEWLSYVPYKEIRERVLKLIPDVPHLMTPQFTFKNKIKFYDKVVSDNEENEGIVLKKLSKPVPFFFNDSKKINHWLKVKPVE